MTKQPTESVVAAGASGAQLKVTQVKSAIGTTPKQRATLRTLGVGRRGDAATQRDRPQIRGMVATVSHLVTVEELE